MIRRIWVSVVIIIVIRRRRGNVKDHIRRDIWRSHEDGVLGWQGGDALNEG